MIVLALAVLGLGLGSFVNALVWRLHEQATHKKLSKQQKKSLSIVSGRSMCSHCRHELAWYDLLPVVSWVMLLGKCRYCGHRIEDSPLVELSLAALFIISYLAWPFGFDGQGIGLFGFWLAFLTGFVALTLYDIKWMELPNRIIYPLVGLVGLQVIFLMATKRGMWLSELIDAFWGLLTIGGLFYALFQVSRGKWIGGGDVKLGFVIGLLVGGPLASVAVIFLASLLGTIVSLPLLVSKSVKANSRIPFGPFLMTATFLVYLYGERLTDLYWDLFL